MPTPQPKLLPFVRRLRRRALAACATALVVGVGCAARVAAPPPVAAPAEAGRVQAKLDDRLRRLEGRLELTQAQLLVLREQLRQVEAAAGRPARPAGRARLLRLHGDEAPASLPAAWSQAQRIATGPDGRVHLVHADGPPAAAVAPPPAAARTRRFPRPPR